MDEIILPEFLNTEEKYNKMIHEVNTLHKFEEIVLKLLSRRHFRNVKYFHIDEND